MSAEQPPRAPKCGICEAIEALRAGDHPAFIAELPQSFAILGDRQLYRGYAILFAKRHVTELHLMAPAEARALFDEALGVGAAIAAVLNPVKLNYECLGNLEPHVHWHVFPRYQSDPMLHAPVWQRPEAEQQVLLADSDRRALIDSLAAAILGRIPLARSKPSR